MINLQKNNSDTQLIQINDDEYVMDPGKIGPKKMWFRTYYKDCNSHLLKLYYHLGPRA